MMAWMYTAWMWPAVHNDKGKDIRDRLQSYVEQFRMQAGVRSSLEGEPWTVWRVNYTWQCGYTRNRHCLENSQWVHDVLSELARHPCSSVQNLHQ